MTYTINRYDGTVLINLVDGVLNTTSTDLALVGKNYSGFGESVNENFIRLLENFASPGSVPPAKPLEGQIWYNKSEARLKVYSATGWKGASGTIVQDSQPLTLTTGDIWIDSIKKKMYFYDGTNLLEASKQWADSQSQTATVAETIYDNSRTPLPKHVLSLYVSGQRLGIFSADSFTIGTTPQGSSTVPDFTRLVKGFNIADSLTATFTFDTTVSRSSNLIDDAGNIYKPSDFMRRTASDTTIGKLTIQNDEGVTVGIHQIGSLKANGYNLYIENSSVNGNIQLTTSNTGQASSPAVFVDAMHQRVGIFTGVPEKTLDVAGDAKVRGDMTITGNLTVNNYVALAVLTSAQRNLLSPSNGFLIYNSDTKKFQGYADGAWVNLN